MIRQSKSSISSLEIKLTTNVLKREFLGMGQEVQEFELAIQKFIGTKKNVICVNSGTAALHLALLALNIKCGDDILVPSITYVASIQAIKAVGANPIFCDVGKDNVFIDIIDLQKKITKKTRAIMPVHYAGDSSNMKLIYQFAKENNIKVIEDAAHSFGSFYRGKRVGFFGDAICFSFDGIKNITSGEGGAVVMRKNKSASFIKDARLLGVINDSKKRYTNNRSYTFDVKHIGFRYHMSNINAAIGLAQLSRFETFSIKRKSIVKNYIKHLSSLKGIRLLNLEWDNMVAHIFPVRVLNNKRDQLKNFLLKKNIQTGFHYMPNHKLSFFKTKKIASLPNCEVLSKELITLPLHNDLTIKNQKYIIENIINFLNDYN